MLTGITLQKQQLIHAFSTLLQLTVLNLYFENLSLEIFYSGGFFSWTLYSSIKRICTLHESGPTICDCEETSTYSSSH